ncbi:hypothetical protein [uncultured Gammaproteobacteria bacterium]|nr:hypothetical protein [uncultured Gammaproteobacteria bacterium]
MGKTCHFANHSYLCKSLYLLQAFDKLPDISTTKTYGQVFADSTYANKNKQTNNIHPFKLF